MGEASISEEPGVNSRLDPLQAAILCEAALLEGHNRHRQAVAAVYRDRLSEMSQLQLPVGADEFAEPVYHQFVIQLPARQRDAVRTRLADLGVGTLLHYPLAAHQMPAYQDVAMDPAGLSETDGLLPRILSLPMGPHLSLDQADQVAQRVEQAIYDTF